MRILCIAVGSLQPLKFIGNSFAVALLLQGGKVLSWGTETYGGSTPDQRGLFIRDIFANSVGFAALTTDRKVISWGDFASIPKKIQEGGDENVSWHYTR